MKQNQMMKSGKWLKMNNDKPWILDTGKNLFYLTEEEVKFFRKSMELGKQHATLKDGTILPLKYFKSLSKNSNYLNSTRISYIKTTYELYEEYKLSEKYNPFGSINHPHNESFILWLTVLKKNPDYKEKIELVKNYYKEKMKLQIIRGQQ